MMCLGLLLCAAIGARADVALPKNFEATTRAQYARLANPEIPFDRYLDSARTEYQRLANLKAKPKSQFQPSPAQMTPCGNGDFESGLSASEWQGAYGTVPSSGNPDFSTFTTGITSGALTLATSHQTLVGPGTDPTVGISLTAPGTPASLHAVRIGNTASNYGSELLSKTFTVTAAQSQISFWYAVVFQDPGHPLNQQPSFWVRVIDTNTGAVVPGAVNLGNNSDKVVADTLNPFFQHSNAGGQAILYKNWSCAQIDLSSKIGKTVTIEFVTEDCAQGAHYGYAYLDNFCGSCVGSPDGNIAFNAQSSATCGAGNLCFNFTLPQAGTTVGNAQITLGIYQNGNLVATKLSPVLTTAGLYCFAIDPATIVGLNMTTGYFDYMATAAFHIGSTTLASKTVGSAPAGRVAGLNNDYKIACATPATGQWCCPGTNIFKNGDFESGTANTGFTSQYALHTAVALGATVPGQYNIVTGGQAMLIDPYWVAADHTTCDPASGHVLVVNGRTGQTGSKVIWHETVPVVAGKQYRFCANAKNFPQCAFDVKPVIQVVMNVPNNFVSTIVNVTGNNACNWQLIAGVVTIPTGVTSLSVDLTLDEQGVGDGNDLALDDIALIEIPQASANYVLVNIATSNMTTGQYNVSASYPTLPPGFGYYWEVCQLNATNNNPIASTLVSNPAPWWTYPMSTAPNTFNGYVNSTTLSSAMAPGVFYTNKRYRITFGVWSDCQGWRQSSWILQFVPGMAKPQVKSLPEREQEKMAPAGLPTLPNMPGEGSQPRLEPTTDMPGANQAAELPKAEDDPNTSIAVATPTVEEGQLAPDFTVRDANGKKWNLSDLRNKKNVLLTFFPKCFTGGCANHLSTLRDKQTQFDDLDTQILAVSVDPAKGDRGQLEFARQWQFAFPLIPDTDRRLSMLYGATQNEHQLAARMSIFIDKRGVVRFVDTNVNVTSHGADVLARIRDLKLDTTPSRPAHADVTLPTFKKNRDSGRGDSSDSKNPPSKEQPGARDHSQPEDKSNAKDKEQGKKGPTISFGRN